MSQSSIEEALTHGLKSGYGGQTQFQSIDRGGFPLKSSHLKEGNTVYHDEWTDGGGQELVRVGDRQYTRLYAGGTVGDEVLTSLGITKKDIIDELKRVILEQGNNTRLHQSCHPAPNNAWAYSYMVLDIDPNVPITIAKESIAFNGRVVFIHDFLLCPIK